MIHTKETIGAQVRKAARGGFVYIASPYTRLASTIGLDEAARIVAMAAGALMEEGVVAFSPIAHGHAVSTAYGFDKTDQKFWMDQCWPIARRASACVLLKMDGWASSSGVKAELAFFHNQKTPVIYVEPEELIPACKW